MADNKIIKWRTINNDPWNVARAEPRKLVGQTYQVNSFGVIEKIPNCPRCGAKHALLIKSLVQGREPRGKFKTSRPYTQQRECKECGYFDGKIEAPRGFPPTSDQIAYANQLAVETYARLRDRYKRHSPKSQPSTDLVFRWKQKARNAAIEYLKVVTGGYDVTKLYPPLKRTAK